MNTPDFPAKIRHGHLQRQALIYIRQSTLMQVRENTGSSARQYQLVDRALELGWPRELITVIDQDQGCSGAGASQRGGFERVIAEVGLGRVGAVFSLEASRLARACSDWYRLLEICALADTLVIDEDGQYDPGQYNDRLLLGFRGTMSEAELHWLHSRLRGGKWAKAERGELRARLPVGLVHDAEQHIVLDPDEEIRQAIRLLFSLFDRLGSAKAVVKHFAGHKLCFPVRAQSRQGAGEVIWQPLALKRALDALHNPCYAGAYVYGRTRAQATAPRVGQARIQAGIRRLDPCDWPIVHRDHHPGYISWEEFQRHQRQLADNRTIPAEDRRGAAREGPSLLQGIVLCGRCGRRMSIRYLRGHVPSYECGQLHHHFGGTMCQSLRGDPIDRAVARALLEAITPAQLELSLATLEAVKALEQQIDQQWQRRLERCRYQADLARRRYLAVDPDNRLVARNLEADWNERLGELERLEREHAQSHDRKMPPLGLREREQILALAHDLPALWEAPTTTQVERKQLLRLLIKDVTLTRGQDRVRVDIRWQTQACTSLDLPPPRPSYDLWRTAPEVVEVVREFAPHRKDPEVAAILNGRGLVPGQGGAFTAAKVKYLRHAYSISGRWQLRRSMQDPMTTVQKAKPDFSNSTQEV